MDGLTTGADVATMAGGLSVVTATIIWGKKQWREYQERRAMIQRRNWNGYVEPGGINEWNVRLVETPDEPSGRVVLEVVDEKGRPHGSQAQNMRTVIERDGKLARVPTPEQWAFLVDLRKRRIRSEAYPI
jgi:hypothetical protein